MQRRRFLKDAVVATGAGTLAATAGADDAPAPSREYFELRSYHVRPGQRERLDAYLQNGLLPAVVRTGRKPAGVFHEQTDTDNPVVWVLIRHPEAAGPAQLASQLAEDAAYLAAATEHLAGPTGSAVYDHVESSILGGIQSLPGLEAPDSGPRLFNLRIYESFNTATLHKKIEMFNEGELAIFRRVGLTPVLFGETLSGPRLPSLTYLLVFDDDAARETAWQTFRNDAEWQRLKAIPEYADQRIVSRITNKLLTPAEYSAI